jgi:hypothetical protein
MNMLNENGAGDVSLDALAVMAQAQGSEMIDGGELDGVTCYGSSTYDSSTGVGYATIRWTSYWFKDPYNPTEEEEQDMFEDLAMSRSEQRRTFTQNSGSNTLGATVGYDFFVTVEGEYSHTFPTNGVSVERVCCGQDHYGRCTHLPTCESYLGMD